MTAHGPNLGPPPVSVNKLSMEHSHDHLFINYLQQFSCYDPQNLKYSLLDFLQKMFPDVCSREMCAVAIAVFTSG